MGSFPDEKGTALCNLLPLVGAAYIRATDPRYQYEILFLRLDP